MLYRLVACLAALAWTIPASHAATALESLDQLRATLRDARARNDWAASVPAARQIKGLLNETPQSRLEVARAEVRADQPAAALAELNTYVAMGQASEIVDQLPDFEPLRQRPEFGAVRASMLANRQPIQHARVAFHIADPELLPEDIDFDPRSGRFLISSVLQHRIVSVTTDERLREFARAPDDWPMMALKVDSQHQRVWATEVALEGWAAVAKSDQGRSAVVCYDLATGKLLRRIEAPRPSSLGDMMLTPDGGLIISDGQHGGLYQLTPGKDRLERLDAGMLLSPQTVAPGFDAAHVYVPDYVRGLGILDLRSRQIEWLHPGGRFALNGIDGLYRVGRLLIALQNGTDPERVIAFTLNNGHIVSEQIIERGTATLGEPTHGVLVDGAFYYIANSGWNALGDDGRRLAGAKKTSAHIMKWNISQQH
jgi:hypothetical protein